MSKGLISEFFRRALLAEDDIRKDIAGGKAISHLVLKCKDEAAAALLALVDANAHDAAHIAALQNDIRVYLSLIRMLRATLDDSAQAHEELSREENHLLRDEVFGTTEDDL